ncbi:phosphatidylglycerol phospholipase C [Monosporozyma unispora]|nr:hypothetical protein C6P44_003704 [Kazachstania unispora]
MSQVQVVGHRAFRGLYPENTLLAFNKAYEAEVDIIETDLQMTQDGVIVVNHDSNTGRTWDRDLIISESKWEDLQKLKNKEDPSLSMMSLTDILEWSIAHPNSQLMLDIKFTNDKLILLRTYSELLKVKDDLTYWRSHLIWGVWLLDWFEYGISTGVFKDFKVIVITMSLDVADQFINHSIKLNNPKFQLYGISVHYISTWTERFRKQMIPILNENDVKVFLWTINKKIDFKYTVGLPIYGTVTDNPVLSREYLNDAQKLIKDKSESTALIPKFVAPVWNTREGIRFYGYIQVYKFVSALLFSKWIHKKFLGISFAYLIFQLLRLIRFF